MPGVGVDAVRLSAAVLEAPPRTVGQSAFGVGNPQKYYQKKTLARYVEDIIPPAAIRYQNKEEAPGDYRVDFSKIKRLLAFQSIKTVHEEMCESDRVLNQG